MDMARRNRQPESAAALSSHVYVRPCSHQFLRFALARPKNFLTAHTTGLAHQRNSNRDTLSGRSSLCVSK